MELGCGIRTMTVKGREYLYVWHYETREGRRKQVYDYVGPARETDAKRRAGEALEAYTRKAMDDGRRRVQRIATLAAGR